MSCASALGSSRIAMTFRVRWFWTRRLSSRRNSERRSRALSSTASSIALPTPSAGPSPLPTAKGAELELHFLPPELRRLDEAKVELCACSIWSDERPMRGLAGLLDWRLGGRLSALVKSGFLQGELGESLLMPGKPHVSFEKVLVVGLGSRTRFDDGTFRQSFTM